MWSNPWSLPWYKLFTQRVTMNTKILCNFLLVSILNELLIHFHFDLISEILNSIWIEQWFLPTVPSNPTVHLPCKVCRFMHTHTHYTASVHFSIIKSFCCVYICLYTNLYMQSKSDYSVSTLYQLLYLPLLSQHFSEGLFMWHDKGSVKKKKDDKICVSASLSKHYLLLGEIKHAWLTTYVT